MWRDVAHLNCLSKTDPHFCEIMNMADSFVGNVLRENVSLTVIVIHLIRKMKQASQQYGTDSYCINAKSSNIDIKKAKSNRTNSNHLRLKRKTQLK
jgi:hypothetical protein